MRLSAFILAKMEPILQEWEDFARALGVVAESLDVAALRDHAEGILRELAADLETYQSEAQQEAKSKGRAPPPADTRDTSAELHGNIRAVDGFTLEQMVSEYRALRASVLRLWTKEGDTHDGSGYEQVTRFNESIDEALAKSVKRYAHDLDRLMAAARAHERLAALGTLSAGLGHDMGNLLLPMAICLRQLEEAGIPPEARSMLDSLHRSIEHLRGLTKGLRSLSVDPEDGEGSPETTDLHEWWTEATSPYKWTLGHEVHLHASGVASSALPRVRVPKHVLMQAVFNLVQNAAQAMAPRGRGNIWVSAEAAQDKASVTLTVRDDGPGMDALTLARCTEPFFTTKPRARGTGLGLTLVRTSLERHGGRLIIESQVGQGTSFMLVLPVGGRGEEPGMRRAILTVRDPRVKAMAAALLWGMGVEVLPERHVDETAMTWTEAAGGARGLLWVADDSIPPREVWRFLDEGGPNARVVKLGGGMSTDQGDTAQAGARRDIRLTQIDAAPSHAMLQAALRGATSGWPP
jgi:signal transduction histidine kinase